MEKVLVFVTTTHLTGDERQKKKEKKKNSEDTDDGEETVTPDRALFIYLFHVCSDLFIVNKSTRPRERHHEDKTYTGVG